ncbi:7SK snRNA methylphosphate capping enzyme [Trichinella murrelli]|uniref:RNA methyltransferase n=2 Tax=Trichinella TaxID=6333 RepID=A0A0V0TQV0_9BILA|nr:7SK snRNA methylphosphate capping enzyme [Trichinella murrelli]
MNEAEQSPASRTAMKCSDQIARCRSRTFSHNTPECEGTKSARQSLPPGHNHMQRFRKRHGSGGGCMRAKRERIELPTKFLLGGNINDPLNLGGLASTGESNSLEPSPAASPNKINDAIDIIIPKNPKDPLNLDNNLEIVASHKRYRKRKRHSSFKLDEGSSLLRDEASQRSHDADSSSACKSVNSSSSKINCDPVVSPVVDAPCSSSTITETPTGQLRSDTPGVKPAAAAASAAVKKGMNKEKSRFRYGNYTSYYNKRSLSFDANIADPRLNLLEKEWFFNKNVLDIGCNSGQLTLAVGKKFSPNVIVGIDIDSALIGHARRNQRLAMDKNLLGKMNLKFPSSFSRTYGPLSAPPEPKFTKKFPENVFFRQMNYVLSSDAFLEYEKAEYDTVIAFSITKWIHLNWGDEGIKRFFKRVYLNLKPGGRLLLEPQAFSSYAKRRGLCQEIYDNYKSITLMPDEFPKYLTSAEVGFASYRTVGISRYKSKGFQRPILLFEKNGEPDKSVDQKKDGQLCSVVGWYIDVRNLHKDAFRYLTVALKILQIEINEHCNICCAKFIRRLTTLVEVNVHKVQHQHRQFLFVNEFYSTHRIHCFTFDFCIVRLNFLLVHLSILFHQQNQPRSGEDSKFTDLLKLIYIGLARSIKWKKTGDAQFCGGQSVFIPQLLIITHPHYHHL